ncbi:carbohydrate kinase family protein [Hyalangium rubrum]|uniref:Carbohydrate kinase family protein n=1 Tax=Hyalangium rubrum TaxID=3103134 RepID=A0ABU5H3V9_9BACT|nr:carbohydrate kinase family protein [Hyalangium sp. s54d21]MDY7228045.1 carbohydrate kinase family protein [Hyalangium sp. s54d21]
MPRALVIGGVSFDTLIRLNRFPEPRSQTVFSQGYHETLGSTGAGKALNLRKLGFDVTLHALVGADTYGQRIEERLRHEGIDFVRDIDPRGTERHVNLMDSDGGRISIYMAHATFEPELDLDRIKALIPTHDYVVLNIINYTRRVIHAVRNAGKELWCDLHDYDGRNPYHADFLVAADCIFMSSDAMPEPRPFMEHMVRSGKKLVVCTHGRHGSSALTSDGRWIETPIVPGYTVRDTNGAGDAFFAGFLFGHSRGHPIEQCLRLASIVGALCVTSEELASPTLSPELLEAEYRRHFG